MPASRAPLALALTLALSIVPNPVQSILEAPYQLSDSTSSSANRALAWLASSQYPNGTYGPYPAYSQIQAAPAAYALWLNNSLSSKARAAYTWLASEFDDATSGIWYEADIPGEILYTLSKSNRLDLLRRSTEDYARLLAFQQSNGGFAGWYDPNGHQVTSSVDTAMALWGLVNARTANATAQGLATGYLLSLQNADGSFNLTNTEKSNRLSSLGPEPISLTALVTMVLRDSSSAIPDAPISKALSYLSQAASGNFSGHAYAAALSALAFNAFGRSADASRTISFIVSNQNADGGFRDEIRTSEGSNALDTGWAAIALQLVQTKSLSPDPLVVAGLIAVVAAPVGVLGVTAYYFRKRRKSLQ